MTKQDIINFICGERHDKRFIAKEQGENTVFSEVGGRFVGAIKFKNDYPYILQDRNETLTQLVALCCLDEPTIHFKEEDLFN